MRKRVETHSYRRATLVTGKRGELHLHIQATAFTETYVF